MMVRELLRLVHAKREGIFHIDLRLRPYGAAGPLGCSLESFCTYYARGGPAHSYERLSLVRLRAVGGDRDLGGQIERLRDEMVYSAQSIDLAELRELRARQVQEKTAAGAPQRQVQPRSARGPGVCGADPAGDARRHGDRACAPPASTRRWTRSRPSASWRKARRQELVAAYHFFRRLINGLQDAPRLRAGPRASRTGLR